MRRLIPPVNILFFEAAILAFACLSTIRADTFGSTYELITLASFYGQVGYGPNSGLVADAEGNLYGTTLFNPSGVSGTFFKLSATNNALTTLVVFNYSNGGWPDGELIADKDGNIYGTTFAGGSNSYGTIFKLSSGTNALSTLYAFDKDIGGNPYAGLVFDSNGLLYGTTGQGGAHGYGTIFRFDLETQTLTTLATFNGTNGANPDGELLLDANGNLFGTTVYGGAHNKGTVFKLNSNSQTIETLAVFDGTNGSHPYAGLTLGDDGNLYGTTPYGGSGDGGTVFRLHNKTNALTTLVTFDYENGYSPYSRLTADSFGNLYGTTWAGGDYGVGTVYRLSAGGHDFTTLASFDGIHGADPLGGLIFDAKGNLYGTTMWGGAGNHGTIFMLSPAVPEPATALLACASLLCLAGRMQRQ